MSSEVVTHKVTIWSDCDNCGAPVSGSITLEGWLARNPAQVQELDRTCDVCQHKNPLGYMAILPFDEDGEPVIKVQFAIGMTVPKAHLHA